MTRAARLAPLLALVALALGPERLPGQGRTRQIDCSFLLLSGCRSYVIEVVRVEPDGTERVQPDMDTDEEVDPDALDPERYLVLKTYAGDRLSGQRAVIWVDRVAGAVGGDWPSELSNDDVRSAELLGVPGDAVVMDDSRSRQRGGSARLVIFAGRDACRTEVNLDDREGGCSTVQGRNVAGKVSAITIRYRAPSPAVPGLPGAIPSAPAAPPQAAPDDSAAAPADSLGAPADSLGAPTDSMP